MGSLATPFGAIVGIGLGPIFVPDDDKNDLAQAKSDIENMLWIMAIAATCSCMPLFLFFKKKPTHFPSKLAQMTKYESFNFLSEFIQLLQNKNYLFLSILFCCNFSVYSCLSAVVNSLISPYGYTGTDTAILGACLVLSGILGAFIYSHILDKY